MNQALKNWWLVLIKGIILVVLSFFVFCSPHQRFGRAWHYTLVYR
jgi:uncharacterized membrane protein HdeD (DUF308 family)